MVKNTWMGIDCSTREYEEGESGSVGVTGVWPTMGQGHVKGRRSDCTALVGVSYLSAKSEELKGCSRHPWCRSLRPACLRRLHPRKAHTVTLRKLRRETFVWNLLLLLLGSLGPSTVTCRKFYNPTRGLWMTLTSILQNCQRPPSNISWLQPWYIWCRRWPSKDLCAQWLSGWSFSLGWKMMSFEG